MLKLFKRNILKMCVIVINLYCIMFNKNKNKHKEPSYFAWAKKNRL